MNRVLVILMAGLILLAGCDGGEETRQAEVAAPEEAAETAPGLPPHEFADLAELFDPLVEPLGLRLTRGSLQEQQGGRYVTSPTGTHLALYVEPTGAYRTRDYVVGLVTATEAVAPMIFERWEGLRSFDICTEPRPAVDDSPLPPPVTQVMLTREAALGIDWGSFDLADLLLLTVREVDDPAAPTGRAATVTATQPIQGHPIYQRAAEEAREAAAAG